MKKIPLGILGIATVMGVSFFIFDQRTDSPQAPPRHNQQTKYDSTGLPTEHGQRRTNLLNYATSRSQKRASHHQTRIHNPSNRVAFATPLSPETAAAIAEAFAVTDHMTSYLDDGDYGKALTEARKLIAHPNREVRMSVVEALDWIGGEAAYDLSSFLADPDPEISQAADKAFWQAIDELDDPALKVNLLEAPLASSSSAIRMEALDHLVFLPDHLSFPKIAAMLNDSIEDVQDLARSHLAFISEEEFRSESEAMDWFRSHKLELEKQTTF